MSAHPPSYYAKLEAENAKLKRDLARTLAAIHELAVDAYDDATDGGSAQNTALAHIMKLVEESR